MRTEDGYIIQECLDGESEAFGVLVDKYREGIYAFVYAKLRNFHDAQDVTQEVFLHAYRNLRTLRRWESFASWLYRIASRRCKLWIRTASRRVDRDFIQDQDPEEIDALSLASYRESQLDESVREALGDMAIPTTGWPLPVETKVLKTGEIPVDILRASEVSIISSKQGDGDGGEPQRDPQNALTLAPQGEGGTWTKREDMPNALCGLSTSVVNGKIYAIGGYDSVDFLSTVEEYDPATGKWTKKADMPTVRTGLSTAVVDGKIYAIGGARGWFNRLSTVEEYDPVADKWTKKADMPTARAVLSTSVVNGKIYVIGGLLPFIPAVCSKVEEYDPVTDTWTKKADMPTKRCMLSTSVVNGKIYAIGGSGIWLGNGLSIVEEYDPVTDTWTKKPNMPTPRFWLSTNVVNGKIYAIGATEAWLGENHVKKPLSTVEEYTPGFVGEGKGLGGTGKLVTPWGEIKSD